MTTSEYGVSATFNVTDLSLFCFYEGTDSRMNHLDEVGMMQPS